MKESRLHLVLTDIIDVIWAGLLWLLCSLPVVTVGASSTALYYCVVKCIRHERGRLTASFFRAFGSNFKQGTLLWLLCLVYLLIGLGDIYAFSVMGVGPGNLLYSLSRLFFLPPLLLCPWLFAYLSRFQNSIRNTLKYSAYLAMRHLGRTLLLALELVGTLVIAWLLPQIIPLLPGVVCLLMSFAIEPVFRPLTADAGGEDAWYNE